MVKLLIVDDEENTRVGLRDFVPWSDLGIDAICVAGEGYAALDLFGREDPDIILCDVRMPRMNGIEFARRAKTIKPDCKVIFLSGFSDKEYLKAAIKLGATDYIEKPLIMNELKAVVAKAVKQLDEERASEKTEHAQGSDWTRDLIARLIQPEQDIRVLKSMIDHVHPHFLSKDTYIVFIALFSFDLPDSKKRGLLDSVSISLPDSLCCFHDATALTLIIHDRDDLFKARTIFHECSSQLLAADSEHPGARHFTLGAGFLVTGIGKIPLSWQTAHQACQKQFFTRYETLIDAGQMNANVFIHDQEQTARYFVKCLMENDKHEALKIIRKLDMEISRHWGTDIDTVKHIMLNLYLILHDAAVSRGIDWKYDEQPQDYFWKRIAAFKTLGELSGYLIHSIEAFFTGLEKKDPTNKKIYRLEAFLEKHYGDKDLSIRRISQHLDLSLNYTCGLFKKMTGMTINDYIVDLRVRKAGEMLRDRDIRIYEIADRVGFRTANYFSRIFKMKTGLSPSEYREKYLP